MPYRRNLQTSAAAVAAAAAAANNQDPRCRRQRQQPSAPSPPEAVVCATRCLVVAAVNLLQLEVLVRDQVEGALLQPEPDHTLRHAIRQSATTHGSVDRCKQQRQPSVFVAARRGAAVARGLRRACLLGLQTHAARRVERRNDRGILLGPLGAHDRLTTPEDIARVHNLLLLHASDRPPSLGPSTGKTTRIKGLVSRGVGSDGNPRCDCCLVWVCGYPPLPSPPSHKSPDVLRPWVRARYVSGYVWHGHACVC